MIWIINVIAEVWAMAAGALLSVVALVVWAMHRSVRTAQARYRRRVYELHETVTVAGAEPLLITHPEDDPYRVACCRECGRPLTVHHEERVQ